MSAHPWARSWAFRSAWSWTVSSDTKASRPRRRSSRSTRSERSRARRRRRTRTASTGKAALVQSPGKPLVQHPAEIGLVKVPAQDVLDELHAAARVAVGEEL